MGKAKKVKKVDKVKKLDKVEFFELELSQANAEILKKEHQILDLKKQLSQSRQATLKYVMKELDVERLDINNELKSLNVKVEKQKKIESLCIADIRKRLKLSGRFGYNSDTLEIL